MNIKLPSRKMIVFNVAGVALFFGGIVGVLREAISPTETQVCSTRYNNSSLFGAQQNGAPMTTAVLQASLNGDDRGIVENLSFENVKGGPASTIMDIRLEKGTGFADKNLLGGIGFPWRPSGLHTKVSACLSYSVRVPVDFEFGSGGTLPGLIGATDPNSVDDPWDEGFRLPVVWNAEGGVAIAASYVIAGSKFAAVLANGRGAIPRDKWVRIEQEVELNTVGQSNGAIRLWIDGRVRAEATGLLIRGQDIVRVAGIRTDVHFGSVEQSAIAPKTQIVQLSPIEVRWK